MSLPAPLTGAEGTGEVRPGAGGGWETPGAIWAAGVMQGSGDKGGGVGEGLGYGLWGRTGVREAGVGRAERGGDIGREGDAEEVLGHAAGGGSGEPAVGVGVEDRGGEAECEAGVAIGLGCWAWGRMGLGQGDCGMAELGGPSGAARQTGWGCAWDSSVRVVWVSVC